MVSKRFMTLLDEIKSLHERKNAGYAGTDNPDPWANFRMCEKVNVPAFLGCFIRMGDKFIRIENLLKNPLNEQVGESLKDTLMDLSVYSLIMICLLEELDPNDIHKFIGDGVPLYSDKMESNDDD